MKLFTRKSILAGSGLLALTISAAVAYASFQERSSAPQIPQTETEIADPAPADDNTGDAPEVSSTGKTSGHNISYEQQGDMMRARKSAHDNAIVAQDNQ